LSAGCGNTRGKIFLVVPGQPSARLGKQRRGVFLQGGQVIEGIDLGEVAGVDEAHEQVTDIGAMFGFVKEGVVAVADRYLQCPFAEIIVQRGLLSTTLSIDGLKSASSTHAASWHTCSLLRSAPDDIAQIRSL
jgi:hypothetical protein